MHIKQIIIQGFKSYKDQTIIEPFSPGTNVIVGRNGSGKSNFFAAIRFVLSDSYNNLSREERVSLLHEGSGSAVNTAYVEVIFDNQDQRFNTQEPEIAIRRTIGHKKDEYSVNKKFQTKKEVIDMLEAAGFSRSNPFYIVPQGRVAAMTNMKETDRLNLLKEVAGTTQYENRRAESKKIIEETNNKKAKIDELLSDVKARMDELEEEREELRGFQDKDRERRSLEYAYYHQQQLAVQQALEELEDTRQEGAGSTSENQQAFIAGEKAIRDMESKLSELQQQLDLLRIDRGQLDEDRRENAKSRAKAELKVKNLAETQSSRERDKQMCEAQLQQVRAEIKAKEAELAKLLPEYENRKQLESQLKQALDSAEAGRIRLMKKQTRSSQFRNKAERDAWLRAEIGDLNGRLGSHKANRINAEEEVNEISRSIQMLRKEITALEERLEGWDDGLSELSNKVAKAKDVMDELDESRKALRRQEDKLNTIISNVRTERDKAERELSHTMDNSTARGLATIRRLKRERDIPGAYGTLADLMEVDEPYRVAAEQTAGASLFHYVVDHESTATELVDALQKGFGGRVTFMPLAQLRPRAVNIPKASDVVPLLDKIHYDPQFESAFQQVFGRTAVCPNLHIAGQYARSHGIDCITAEGDTANKRGAMTGGYIDTARSRLAAVRSVNKWRDEFDRLVAEVQHVRREIEKKDQEITSSMGEHQKLMQQLRRASDGHEPLRAELRSKEDQLVREQDRLDAAIARRDTVDRNMKDFDESVQALEAELVSEFKKALTNQEEQQLEDFISQVQDLQKQWNDASSARTELETRKQSLEVELRQNLRLREHQLSSKAHEGSISTSLGGTGNYADAQKELKKWQKASAALEKQIQQNEAQIEKVQSQISQLQEQKSAKEQEQQEIARQIERQKKRMEKSLQRKALLTAQADECSKSIRDLGVLPEEAFHRYQRMKSSEIQSRLKRVNQELKKYRHVNKKAFEQYTTFTTQQEQLLKRREELDESQKAIYELIDHLDREKDEMIGRTFKQVSKAFAEFFERLVPAGHGRLVIQRRMDRRGQDPEDSDEERQRSSIDNYVGVGISVSFNSKIADEQQKIQQLSGGQKSLCALCLIFAIQNAESSPFVIFDEVDANLDAQYRTAVAALLQQTSAETGTQFICTTFRPEIVHVADKCYGVTFRNKTSFIDVYDADDALEFVEGQAPK
ncbi:Structural maintenance of chromosomes protein [Pleurostoma richardsiae]|uniref:Structural maintenance of chromosomes protein n=1 Tax=Pleurostoma richardsiae TaxID=41990 RepID=A0AA38VGN6_9PEZI|nr:Structural maintenance of chromosomes protein [Pleurostoma richardsiae]